ncbi:MAG: MBL fold metallo-hydrolase [Eubacteriales bacterium]
MAMRLESLALGMISTNVYFVENSETREMLIIDPADNADRIKLKVSQMQGKPVAILLTHGHYDHFGAAADVRDAYKTPDGKNIPIICGEKEQAVLDDPEVNTSPMHGVSATLKADKYVKDGDVLHLAGFEIHVLWTPGHTIGGVCYYFPNEHALFSGDTLFCQSYGRTDFPTGSSRQMIGSVRRLLRELPDNTDVYPGHEYTTTIRQEKRYNPLAIGN